MYRLREGQVSLETRFEAHRKQGHLIWSVTGLSGDTLLTIDQYQALIHLDYPDLKLVKETQIKHHRNTGDPPCFFTGTDPRGKAWASFQAYGTSKVAEIISAGTLQGSGYGKQLVVKGDSVSGPFKIKLHRFCQNSDGLTGIQATFLDPGYISSENNFVNTGEYGLAEVIEKAVRQRLTDMSKKDKNLTSMLSRHSSTPIIRVEFKNSTWSLYVPTLAWKTIVNDIVSTCAISWKSTEIFFGTKIKCIQNSQTRLVSINDTQWEWYKQSLRQLVLFDIEDDSPETLETKIFEWMQEVHGTNLFQFEVNPEWHNRELSRPTVKIIVNSYKENQAFATMPDSKWCTLALHPKYGIDTYTDSAGNKIKFAAGKPKEKPASAEDAAPVQPIHSPPTAQQNKSGGTSNTSSGGASSGAYASNTNGSRPQSYVNATKGSSYAQTFQPAYTMNSTQEERVRAICKHENLGLSSQVEVVSKDNASLRIDLDKMLSTFKDCMEQGRKRVGELLSAVTEAVETGDSIGKLAEEDGSQVALNMAAQYQAAMDKMMGKVQKTEADNDEWERNLKSAMGLQNSAEDAGIEAGEVGDEEKEMSKNDGGEKNSGMSSLTLQQAGEKLKQMKQRTQEAIRRSNTLQQPTTSNSFGALGAHDEEAADAVILHGRGRGKCATRPAWQTRLQENGTGLKARLTNGFWPPVRKILGRLLKLKKGV